MHEHCREVAMLLQLQQGDAGAYNEFYTFYRRWLLVTATGILQHEAEAEELVQEFFIDCWQHRLYLKIPNSSREAIHNYLFISIRNRCINRMAKEDTRLKRLERFLQTDATNAMPVLRMENMELQQRLDSAINQLPRRQGQVFRAAYLEDKSRKDIANQMRISENTVKKQMQLALKNLRGLLRNIS